jgi:tetratricopeptide (TPR) repeat protein
MMGSASFIIVKRRFVAVIIFGVFICGSRALSLGQHEKAIDDFSVAIELDAKGGIAFSNRAQAYERLAKHDLAEKDRAKVEELGYRAQQR